MDRARLDARQAWQVATHWLLPPHCLLCGARGVAGLDVCTACAMELPRNTTCCLRCAVPLVVATPLCGRCLRRPPPWHAAWVPFRYGWPLDRLETRLKFGAHLACGAALASLWRAAPPPVELPEAILPVPLHVTRLRQRGYNQSLELARPLARHFGVPLVPRALSRVRATAAQTELDARARRRNVEGAFALDPAIRLPAHVAIVDDVMTTGATLAACTRALLRGGVTRVDVWALARAAPPRA